MRILYLVTFLFCFSTSLYSRDTVTIVAVGDIMMGTHYPSKEHLPPNNDCLPQLSLVRDILRSGDVTFGNLEGVLTDSHTGAKSCNNPSVCYTFAMPTKFTECLVDAGFDVMSIANNHVGDFGEVGRKSTIDALKKANLHFAGLISCPTDTFTINGVKYGFCAFAPNTGTLSVKDIAVAQKIVKKLDAECDIVIVSFHAGAEGRNHQNVTKKTETFLGENRGNVYEFAHKMIDAGGDVLLGHGPHVTRAVEVYKNRFIAYSMGNFCCYSRISLSGESGLSPIFKILTDKEGKFLEADIVSTQQIKSKPVQIDSDKKVLKIIQKLTTQNFPEMSSAIKIDDNGKILPLK